MPLKQSAGETEEAYLTKRDLQYKMIPQMLHFPQQILECCQCIHFLVFGLHLDMLFCVHLISKSKM